LVLARQPAEQSKGVADRSFCIQARGKVVGEIGLRELRGQPSQGGSVTSQ
jgi:hypothetical protein